MGIDIEREPFTPICDRLWMCDYERVEDHGAYRDVIVRLEIMTAGWLKLASPADHVDVEAGRAAMDLVNGLGHPAWSVMQGGYTPGLITSLMFLPLAVLLAKRLCSERATAT